MSTPNIDPIRSLMIDVNELWISIDVGTKMTARGIYKTVIKSKERNPDIHKLNAIGSFLSTQVRYNTAKKISDRVVDPVFEKISIESSRPKNKRFCDVMNESFTIDEVITTSEFSLCYKDMHSKYPITKGYTNKLFFALERHKCLEKISRGKYKKARDISEHEMTIVTRFIKIKKAPTPVVKTMPSSTNLPQHDGYATVNSVNLEEYIKEVRSLKLIIKALRKELEEKDRFIRGLPVFDLPPLDTTEYEDLKQKYGIT